MRSRGLDRVKKKVKFQKKLENRCMSVDTLFFSKDRVESCRIMVYICRNIQALVNTVVLTPASCPKGVCGHGKTIFGAGVNSLLIVHKGTGKIAAHYSACAPSGQGPKQRVVSGIFKI